MSRIYLFFVFLMLLTKLVKKILKGKAFFKTPTQSLDIYEAYDDREIRDDESASFECLIEGRIKVKPASELRDAYLNPVVQEIERLSKQGKRPIHVLEVGCGNAINLVRIKRIFGDRVNLTGADISPRRIDIGKRHFGNEIKDIKFAAESITNPNVLDKLGRFDLVFSVHCLEQITYGLEAAVRNLDALATQSIVLIEPTWEHSSPVQRLYLLLSDHAKIIIPTIAAARLRIRHCGALAIQSSLKNQSTLIVIDKN